MSIQARFVGICRCGCGETIAKDDWVVYSETLSGWIHEGHVVRSIEDRKPTCPKCYLQHAGECF